MVVTLFQGYPDLIGRREAFCGSAIGPTAYSQTTKDVLQPFGFQQYYDAVHSSITVSGTYLVRWEPSIAGVRATWKGIWIVISTGNEVENAVDLSAEKLIVSGFCGKY